MAAVESNYNASEMLTEVNNAIYAVLVGGQSYKIGTRQLTRADLSPVSYTHLTLPTIA